jgi:hypothetical protein
MMLTVSFYFEVRLIPDVNVCLPAFGLFVSAEVFEHSLSLR